MSEFATKIESRVSALTAPIAGSDTGVGIDVSYDPQFERIKTEIDKLATVASDTPDWREVLSTSEQLLVEKSKDFRLAVWSTLARQRMSSVEGLAEGLAVMTELCKKYWDDMYPPARRARARGNLADWLNEQVAAELQSLEPKAEQGEALKAVQSLSDELDELLSTKLSGAYAGLGTLRSLLRDKVRQIPESAPAPAAVTAPTSATAAAPQTAPAASAPASPVAASAAPMAAVQVPDVPTISGASDILPALRALGKGIVEVVGHMRRADPAQASAYRLQRTGIWLAVSTVPPSQEGLTRIPPPGADIRNKLTQLGQNGQWSELLSQAEGYTSTYLFWFDLHRHVATAMDRLGALYLDARQVVGREVSAFLSRFPNTERLSFSDGTPFADAATQTWLEEERGKHASGGGGEKGTSAHISEEDAEVAQRFEEARNMVNEGKLAEGLSLAAQLAMRGADARTRFRSRMAVAQLAIQGGRPEIGRPMLETLIAEADAHHLDEWEPQLCASAYAAYLSCERPAPGKPERPEFRGVFDRLCRIDPALAIKFAAV